MSKKDLFPVGAYLSLFATINKQQELLLVKVI